MYVSDITPAVWTISSGEVSELALCHTSGQNIYIVPLISRPGMLEKMINLVMFSVLVPATIYTLGASQATTQARPYEVSRLESYLMVSWVSWVSSITNIH